MYLKPCLTNYLAEMVLDEMGTVQAASIELYIQSVPFSYNNQKPKSAEVVRIAKADNETVRIYKIS